MFTVKKTTLYIQTFTLEQYNKFSSQKFADVTNVLKKIAKLLSPFA
jgi:hypothetical protein